jgi:hypothetical protein
MGDQDCPVCEVTIAAAYDHAFRALDRLHQLVTDGPADQLPAAAHDYANAIDTLVRLHP